MRKSCFGATSGCSTLDARLSLGMVVPLTSRPPAYWVRSVPPVNIVVCNEPDIDGPQRKRPFLGH